MTTFNFLLVAPMLLFSMVAHEYAHGYAAYRQGDDTASVMGRLSWNPLRHIDLFMTVLLPVTLFLANSPFIFGGAKPVPVDPAKYRNYRRGDIIVSMAGIVTNICLAILLVPAIIGLGMLSRVAPALSNTFSLLQLMFALGVYINLLLAMFNLMPIPPLDGSHVMKHLLPAPLAIPYARFARFGFLALLLIMMLGAPLLRAWMMPAMWANAWAVQLFSPYLVPSPWTT